MRNVHKWNNEKARTVLQRFGLRKPYERKVPVPVPKKKDYHVKKQCSMEHCLWSGFHIEVHLVRDHHMKIGDENYDNALSAARQFVPLTAEKLKEIRESSMREKQRFEESRMIEEESDSTSKTCKKEIEDTMCLFLNFLLSADCNFRDPKSSKQTVQEVRSVLTYVGQFLNIFDRSKVRDGFFKQHLDPKSKPSTSKRYLSSLISFMDFGISEGLDHLPYEIPKGDFVSMKLRFSNWRKAYGKKCEAQYWENEEELQEVLITEEQIATYEDGEMARNAIKLIGTSMEDESFLCSRSDFVMVRDYLLTAIALANAHR